MTPVDPMEVQSDFDYDNDLFYYLVEVTATATQDLAEPMQFTWSGIDADGVSLNDTPVFITSGVVDSADDFPGWVEAGETVKGIVMVGFPTEHGSLILKQSTGSGPMVGDLGYELEF